MAGVNDTVDDGTTDGSEPGAFIDALAHSTLFRSADGLTLFNAAFLQARHDQRNARLDVGVTHPTAGDGTPSAHCRQGRAPFGQRRNDEALPTSFDHARGDRAEALGSVPLVHASEVHRGR